MAVPDQPHRKIDPNDHRAYMEYALDQAEKSPPSSSKFCVGAILLDGDKNEIIATGYSLELPGNTHAEECCFKKVAVEHGVPEEQVGKVLPPNTVLYTTMEPCNERLSGNKTCVERILTLNGAIRTIYQGISEPETFIGENKGRARLEGAGIRVLVVEGMQDRILAVATKGHETK